MSSIKVLLTREPAGNEKLARFLVTKGWECIEQPLLQVSAVEFSAQQQQAMLAKIPFCDTLVVTSQNALRYCPEPLFNQLAQRWREVMVMGPATKALLPALCGDVIGLPGNSEKLCEQLAAMPSRSRIFLLTGAAGRRVISRWCHQHGVELERCVVYRRVCPQIPAGRLNALQQEAHVVPVLTCTTALKYLFRLYSAAGRNWVCNLTFIAVSERIAQYARKLGIRHIEVAGSMEPVAIEQALQRLM